MLGEGTVKTATYDSYETNKRSGKPSSEGNDGTETNRRSQKNVDNNTSYSSKDFTSRKLSKGQQGYFKDSNVRDEIDGRISYKAYETIKREFEEDARNEENKSLTENKSYSLKFWHTDLNKTQFKLVEKWIGQAANHNVNRITDTAS